MVSTFFTLDKQVTVTAAHTFRLQVWVSGSGWSVPPEIFRYKTLPTLPHDTDRVCEYDGVCSYADMLNYPAAASNDHTAFFRKNSIDITYEAKATLQDFWETLQTNVQSLVDDIDAVQAAAVVETGTEYNSLFKVTVGQRSGGAGNSVYVDIAVTLLPAQAGEIAVFVVEDVYRDSVKRDTSVISVASYADIEAYGTTVVADALYRVSSITFAIAADKVADVVAAFHEDLTQIFQYQADLVDSPDVESIDVEASGSGDLTFGDLGALA